MKYFVKTKLSENIHETPEGYLLCLNVPIARTGEMIYGEGETPLEPGQDGKVVIERDEEEVFRPETIASFEGKALTITHPTDFVDPANWSRLAKGIMQNVRRGKGEDSQNLIADILITDIIAINLVKKGLREVSCGYEAEYVQVEEGRGRQTKIVGNHLALVEEGRAGSTYAINDHKKGASMKLTDKIKAIFARAQDEAMKAAEDTSEGMKKEASKDADAPLEKKEEKAKDAGAYDELVKCVKDLSDKVAAMAKPADEKKEDPPAPKEEQKDADPMAALEDRLKALEASVAKLLAGEVGEEMGDEKEDEKKESADEDEGSMVGDSAYSPDVLSRAEILSPGIEAVKDIKTVALKAAYATKDGKRVIDSLAGGKPKFEGEAADTLFVAASELIKSERSGKMAKTKTSDFSGVDENHFPTTPEEINRRNAEFYKTH